MMVVGDFHFTNVHTGTTSVQKTFLVVRRPRHLWLRRSRFEGNLGVQGHKIRPGRTTTGRAIWYIQPPIEPPGKPLRARAIFVDRFPNEHRTALLTFPAQLNHPRVMGADHQCMAKASANQNSPATRAAARIASPRAAPIMPETV
jgi:hypothetical protein